VGRVPSLAEIAEEHAFPLGVARCQAHAEGRAVCFRQMPCGEHAPKYKTIVVDPPWQFDQVGWRRSVPYGVLSMDKIAAMPLGEWAADDAHLYLWTTNSFMAEAYGLAGTWGFKVKTILTWVKPRLGLGTYFRNNTEHVLFAVKGSLRTQERNVVTAFRGERGAHSEKPQAFYDMVETMSPGPWLDVFARKQRFGWDVWGNEVYCAPGLPTPEEVFPTPPPGARDG